MSQSANIVAVPTHRERKRIATRDALIAATRRLAIEHCYSSVTVEQICESVGVSRRTFFNYFPTKDSAWLGQVDRGIPPESAARFIARGRHPTTRSSADRLSRHLLEDVVEMFTDLAGSSGGERADIALIRAGVERDPRLLAVLHDTAARRQSELVSLISRREGLETSDPRAQAAATIFAALHDRAIKSLVDPANTDSYADLLAENIRAARAVFRT